MSPRTVYVTCIAFAFMLAISACSSTPAQPIHWTTYRSAEAGFEVVVPEGHSFYDDTKQHAFGEHRERSVYWRKPALDIADLGIKLVSAGYYDISQLDTHLDPSFILDSFAREEMRLGGTAENGRVIGISTDTLQGFPARQIRSLVNIGKSDSLFLFEQFVLRGNKMYHLRLNGYMRVLDTGALHVVRRSFRLIG